jgi:hypothetical protein
VGVEDELVEGMDAEGGACGEPEVGEVGGHLGLLCGGSIGVVGLVCVCGGDRFEELTEEAWKVERDIIGGWGGGAGFQGDLLPRLSA